MSAELAARRTAAAAVLADFRSTAAALDRARAPEQAYAYAEWALRLAGMLALVLDGLAVDDTSAAQLAEIRLVLEAFDWEFSDRQLALEAIDRIVNRDQL